MKIYAVVLAGGANNEEMRSATGVSNRALVELEPGSTMLDTIVNALRAANSIVDVVVVGDVPNSSYYRRLPAGHSFVENLIAGVKAVPDDQSTVLIATSDIPFITADAIDDFVQQAQDCGGNFSYPIIPMAKYQEEFSEMRRTTLKLAEGSFTGGNVVLLNTEYVLNHGETIKAAYAARKDILSLGRMLGIRLLVRIVLSQLVSPRLLTIPMLEQGVSRVLGPGIKARAIISQFASLGTDVDKPDDVRIARDLLRKRQPNQQGT